MNITLVVYFDNFIVSYSKTKFNICTLIICNLTNTNLLTIGRHYTLPGSSAFLHFEASEAQEIVTAYTKMHHKSKKALVNQGLWANFQR